MTAGLLAPDRPAGNRILDCGCNGLVGRKREMEAMRGVLTEAFAGNARILLVRGAPGTGKTALAEELGKETEQRVALFCRGKFNQYQQEFPYAAFRQAMRCLLSRMCAEASPLNVRWRERILESLGGQARILVDLVPEFEELLGPLPGLADISRNEGRHRLAAVMKKFLQLLSRPEHPLVLFLDDWQWADAESIELLRRLEINSSLNYFLLIAAFRDTEVHATHPFRQAIAELEKDRASLVEIRVPAFDLEDVGQVVAATFPEGIKDPGWLVGRIWTHTAGNPLFLKVFLELLKHRRLVRRDPDVECWTWDRKEILTADLPGNAVQLFVESFAALPAKTQSLLSLAACLGSRFKVDHLLLVAGNACEWSCVRTLLDLGDLGYLTSGLDGAKGGEGLPDEFHFTHDWIQQAAYNLVPAQEMPGLRLRIGTQLLSSLSPSQIDEHLFDIAQHFEAGRGAISTDEEGRQAFATLLLAARKAMDSAAYTSAFRFHEAAGRFMEDRAFALFTWKHDRADAFLLYRGWSETAFLNGEPEKAETLIREALAHARTAMEKAELLNVLIVHDTLLAHYEKAIAAGREALSGFGCMLPDAACEEARDEEIANVREAMKRLGPDAFDLPEMTDPEAGMAVRLLIAMGPPCYRSHPKLWAVIVPKAVNLVLRHGTVPQVGYSHTAMAGLLIWVDGDFGLARTFRDMAKQAMAAGSPSDRSVYRLMNGSSARFWFEPLAASSRDFEDAYEIGVRHNNLQYAAYAFGHDMYFKFFRGVPLELLKQDTAKALAFSRCRSNRWAVELLEGGQHVFEELSARQGKGLPSWDERAFITRLEATGNIQVLCIFRILRLFQHLIMHDLDRAFELSGEIRPMLHAVGTQGLLPWPMYVCARLLVLTGLYVWADGSTRRKWTAELEGLHDLIECWARHAPANFGHIALLAAAERKRTEDDPGQAQALYAEAIDQARDNGALLWEGLANDRAARFWEFHGAELIGLTYRQQAYSCFGRWGARAKLASLEEEFKRHFSPVLQDLGGRKAPKPSTALYNQLIIRQMDLLRFPLRQAMFEQRIGEGERARRELREASDNLRQEIANRLEIEKALRISEERFRLTFDQSPVGAAIVSMNFGLSRVNEALCDILGYGEGELAELDFMSLVHHEFSGECREHMRLLAAREIERYQADLVLVGKEERRVWCRLSMAVSVSEDGTPLFFLPLVEDITARKQAEEDLLLATRKAEAANEAKSAFLANMSHELRTPLNGIMGMLQLIQSCSEQEDVLDYAAGAMKSCDRLTRLVSDILDLSRIEARQLAMQNRAFQLLQTVTEIVDLFTPVARQKGVDLTTTLDERLPRTLLGDSVRLQQILTNLIGNALKFTMQGSVRLEGYPLRSPRPGKRGVLFLVSDTGIGIPDDKLVSVFDAFSQASEGFTRGYQGAGLGLSICKKIVGIMNGSMAVESEPGSGTTFAVRLDYDLPEAHDDTREETIPAAGPKFVGQVLYVEDDPISRFAGKRLLQLAGCEAMTAENGAQALELLRSHDFDAVFMDVQMPVMDGVTATRKIRSGVAGERNADIPVIAMTSYAMAGDKDAFLEAGMTDYIAKPVRIDSIERALAAAFER